MVRAFALASILLCWDQTPRTDGYKVYSGRFSGIYDQVETTATNCIPITEGRYYRVSAFNAFGESQPSLELYVPPPQLAITTIIEKADFVNGPWTAVATFSNSFQIKTQQFFRARLQTK